MAITEEKRRENSPHQWGQSKGQTTDLGKSISSRNSTTHALTAKKIILDTEDPAAIAAREDHWENHFKPQSPDACYFLDECVHATILADRFHLAHDVP